MSRLFRKLRGVLGVGLTWAIPWGAIFAALILVVGVIDPDQIDPGEGPIEVGGIMGFVGFVSGVCFGVLLSFAENGKSILDISLGRAAMWGILGSAAYPLLTGREDAVFLICPLGAAVSMASVAIARKASLRDPEPRMRLVDVISSCVLTSVRGAVNSPKERAKATAAMTTR